jgi:hypothetical protein
MECVGIEKRRSAKGEIRELTLSTDII